MESVAFAAFAALAVGCALIALFHRSIVHSAFALMGTFLGMAGLFLLLGSDFLAVVQLLVYVGGILVLILFGLMLTKPDPIERKVSRIAVALAAIGVPVVLLVGRVAETARWAAKEGPLPEPASGVREIGLAFLLREGYLVPFELAAVLLLVALVGAVYLARRSSPPREEKA
jgi:NADH-quinone oxidoreductase subunit J